MTKKHIVKVVSRDGNIELMVDCWHCHRTPILGEDDVFCEFCMNEIDQTNIDAWTEYEEEKPEPTLFI